MIIIEIVYEVVYDTEKNNLPVKNDDGGVRSGNSLYKRTV